MSTKVLVHAVMFLLLEIFLNSPLYCSEHWELLSRNNVVWDTPSKDSSGSMPIGNGDIGLNVWAEENGDLLMLIGKTDSWCENCRLLKLGRVRISFSTAPFATGNPFLQTLKLRGGEIEIKAGKGDKAIRCVVWVDANNPVIRVEVESPSTFDVKVSLETWRTSRRKIQGDEINSAYGLHGDNPNPVYVEPDVILDGQKDRIIWFHRNEYSCYPLSLKQQDLGDLLPKYPDPLLHRTFGALIEGDGLVSTDKQIITSKNPSQRFVISIYPLTAQTETIDAWLDSLQQMIQSVNSRGIEHLRTAHHAWWSDFWNRSWIYADGDNDAESVTLGYTLQNWINACGGRGKYPIKFNGSIFNVEKIPYNKQYFDADFRLWGGPFWFQNTRLLYWPMLVSGNFDMIKPFFQMYLDALPLAKDRTKIYFNHGGAYFPETMYFWGAYATENYGWNRAGKQKGITDNRYIRYYWQGGLELSMMMLDYFEMTGDNRFFSLELLPFISEIITFYDLHYPCDSKGLIKFDPAQSLETYWDSVNPMPEIAGLKSLLERLINLPDSLTTGEQRKAWTRISKELPPLPMRTVEGQALLGFADSIGQKENMENPELYAVFPYHLYGIGKDGLDLARKTFENRVHKRTGCWFQDSIDAAMLGLAKDAKRDVVTNFTLKNPESRFTAFWGHNVDWIPDEDNGGVAMIALQKMLLQTEGSKIYLLPAWPDEWECWFKLHAPYKTTVEGKIEKGKVVSLKVEPESRRADVIIMK